MPTKKQHKIYSFALLYYSTTIHATRKTVFNQALKNQLFTKNKTRFSLNTIYRLSFKTKYHIKYSNIITYGILKTSK